MKVVVVVKPARGRAYHLLRHCYLTHGRDTAEVPSITGTDDRVIGLLGGLNEGVPLRSASIDSKSLLGEILPRKAEVRHVIISAENQHDPLLRGKSFQALADLAEQFAEKYAPGVPWIGILHEDREHPHAHLVFRNECPNDSALIWDRSALQEMQSMEWVDPDTRTTFPLSRAGEQAGSGEKELTCLTLWPISTQLNSHFQPLKN